MLSIKDFKQGQPAYILTINRGKTPNVDIEKCFIISVGRKYVKVGKSLEDRFPTEYCNSRGYDDYYSPKEDWRSTKRLFPTQQQAVDSVEKENLKREIKKQIEHQKLEMLTLTQLQKINDILAKTE